MNTERLFPVVVDSDLLDHLEPHVRITVVLQEALTKTKLSPGRNKALDDLQQLLSAWGLLGFSAAMPSEGLFQLFHGRREDIFSCGFRLSRLDYAGDIQLEWLVDYDAISEAWLDILLNCLEGFHVQVAPIARVELTSEIEPPSALPPKPRASFSDGTDVRSLRRRRWWPFGTPRHSGS